ncbi:MAG: CoA-transferase, partial [Syntrophomonadaceae bacterium]|nr:CoA-transferase [Syntrophomonadaceae bacterium]
MTRPLQDPKTVEILSLEEAVKKYTYDGMSIGFSGFTAGVRNPVAFVWEMMRQGRKDLHVLDRHGGVCTFLLNAAKRIKIYETDWYGWGELAGKLDLNFERQYKAGEILAEEYAHGATAFRMLAGALGIPFIPYYAPLGSDLYNPAYDRLGSGWRQGEEFRPPPDWDAGFEFSGGGFGPEAASAFSDFFE